eukprot:gene15475-18376_t
MDILNSEVLVTLLPRQRAAPVTTQTPEWRKGARKVDLCNACGLRYLKMAKRDRDCKERHSILKILNPV